FIFFTNRGEPLLSIRNPDRRVVESLARFSRGRRQLEDWHYDIAVFPTELSDVWERVEHHYTKPEMPLIERAAQSRLSAC
ncbi:MAG TPA: hypothetical protein VK603_21935, partial [Candidatus Saccharimonadales bacterium]|nr:hypothetical protein [Candidatus Saccharimonadales bacterium]